MGVNPDIPSCSVYVILVGILAIPGVTIHLTFTLDTHADPLLCKKACTGGARAPVTWLHGRAARATTGGSSHVVRRLLDNVGRGLALSPPRTRRPCIGIEAAVLGRRAGVRVRCEHAHRGAHGR